MAALNTVELKSLFALMREMLEAASSADWQVLTRLDSERRALLKYEPLASESDASDEFVEVVAPIHNQVLPANTVECGRSDDDEHESLVAQIRILDEQIIRTVQAERQKLLAENRELSAQVKAKNRYAQTSSMT